METLYFVQLWIHGENFHLGLWTGISSISAPIRNVFTSNEMKRYTKHNIVLDS